MAKLQRKSAKLFASEATATAGGLAQFGSLAAGTPNYSTDPDVIQALDAYKEGWSSAVLGTKSPALEDRNALDYLLSYQQAYIMQHGIPEWLDTETYYIGSVVSQNSSIYISLADNNTNNALTNTTYWRKFYTPTEIDAFLAQKANVDFNNVNQTGKTTSTTWSLPDYSAGINISVGDLPYTATSNGVIIGRVSVGSGASAGRSLLVNGTYIIDVGGGQATAVTVPVSAGDILSLSDSSYVSFSLMNFFPLKGVN